MSDWPFIYGLFLLSNLNTPIEGVRKTPQLNTGNGIVQLQAEFTGLTVLNGHHIVLKAQLPHRGNNRCSAGTKALFQSAVSLGRQQLVYGDLPLDRPDLFFTEETPIHTSSPYSASKASADLLVGAYHRTFGLRKNAAEQPGTHSGCH